MANQQIKEALEWRYAVKRFDATKKISAQDWNTLTESLALAPSSFGLQPWKFIVVENPEIREKLKPVSWGQTQVTDASHYVVLAARDGVDEKFIQEYINRVASVRGIPADTLEGYKNMMIDNLAKAPQDKMAQWAKRQVYIALGFVLETAALLKIDATPMEGFDPGAYDKILGLEGTGWNSVVTVALGYRHAEDSFQALKKVRNDNSALIQYVK